MATDYDVYMSFWLLIVIFTRLANFLVVEIDKLDLDASGFTTCCVVEMTWVNMPDRLVQELRIDSDRFLPPILSDVNRAVCHVLGWWDHTFHVYQLTADSRYLLCTTSCHYSQVDD